MTLGKISANGQRAATVASHLGIRLFDTVNGDALSPIIWQCEKIEDLSLRNGATQVTTLHVADGTRTEWSINDWNFDPEAGSLEELSHLVNAVAGKQLNESGRTLLQDVFQRTQDWKQWRAVLRSTADNAP